MDRARRQREVVEAIRQIGGEVWYDYQAATDYYWIPICEGDPPPEDWVSVNTYLGRDFFHDVVGVSFYIGGKVPEICPICESDLAILGALKGLRSLDIRCQNVSDRGMKHLAPLTQLELLDASWTGLDDDGTRYLKSMISLRVLELDGTDVTDGGLVPLHTLRNLEQLSLIDTNVTLEGVKNLQEALPNCEIEY